LYLGIKVIKYIFGSHSYDYKEVSITKPHTNRRCVRMKYADTAPLAIADLDKRMERFCDENKNFIDLILRVLQSHKNNG